MLSAMAHDAYRFIMRNRLGMEEAPLQVYYSALLFAPAKSIVRQQFQHEIPGWVKIKSKVQKDWGSLLQTLEGHTGLGQQCSVLAAGGTRSRRRQRTGRSGYGTRRRGQPLQALESHTVYGLGLERSVLAAGGQGRVDVRDRTVRLFRSEASTCARR